MKAPKDNIIGPCRGRAASVPLLVCAVLAAGSAALASDIVAVNSEVSRDYVRARLSDGSPRPETYTFGEGGFISWFMPDATIDKLDFKTVAHVIAAPLAGRKYLPATDPATTRLLVMVYWGTTSGARDLWPTPGRLYQGDAFFFIDRMRYMLDFQNAGILGYNDEGLIGTEEGYWLQTTTALRHKVEDQIDDVERSRYFVVLMGYDFQMMWKQRQPKLLWVTRFSIAQRSSDFGRELPTMLKIASKYFGRNSHGLIRDVVPEGRVEVGEPKPVGTEP